MLKNYFIIAIRNLARHKAYTFINVLAWPVAYYAMSSWLANFAYRIDLSPVYFVASTAVALAITLIGTEGCF